MKRKNTKRYTRGLDVRAMLLVLLFGLIATSLGCGFVHMRTRRVTTGDQKRGLEREIVSMDKEIATLELRFAQATDREALEMRVNLEGSELVQIGTDYRTLHGVAIERVAMRADSLHSPEGR